MASSRNSNEQLLSTRELLQVDRKAKMDSALTRCPVYKNKQYSSMHLFQHENAAYKECSGDMGGSKGSTISSLASIHQTAWPPGLSENLGRNHFLSNEGCKGVAYFHSLTYKMGIACSN